MTPKREFSPGITSRRPPPALHILNHCLLSTTCRELLKITQNLRNFPNCGLSSINLKCGTDTLRGRRMYPLPFLVGLVPSPVQMKRIATTNLEVQGKSGKQPARFGLCAVFWVPLWYALYIGLPWSLALWILQFVDPCWSASQLRCIRWMYCGASDVLLLAQNSFSHCHTIWSSVPSEAARVL